MRKLCTGYNLLEDETVNIGALDIISRISFVHDVADGLYEVVICNESRDFETGYIDDYDLRLVPFNLDGEK
jgi:hypothetical protein